MNFDAVESGTPSLKCVVCDNTSDYLVLMHIRTTSTDGNINENQRNKEEVHMLRNTKA